MSETAEGESERGGEDASTAADGLVETELRMVHPGDHARVIADSQTLDPAAVLSVWPYAQQDFDGDRHRDDLYVRTTKVKDHTVENPQWETVHKPRARGIRATFATPEGSWYAAVDWSKTDDPPLLYLLVIESDEPEDRRWSRVGTVSRVQRYGEPDEDRRPDYRGNLPSEDIPPWEVERDADPTFQGFRGGGDD